MVKTNYISSSWTFFGDLMIILLCLGILNSKSHKLMILVSKKVYFQCFGNEKFIIPRRKVDGIFHKRLIFFPL